MAHPIIQRVLAAKGNSLVADKLIRDYLPFIQSEVSKTAYANRYGDELSIAMIAFHEAIEAYLPGRGAFLNYAAVVIKNRLIDYYRSESRHNSLSLSTPLEGDELTLEDTLVDPKDEVEELDNRSATEAEIAELSQQLSEFGLSLSDIADQTPKQARTLEAAQEVLRYVKEHPRLIQELLATKKLPIKAIVDGTGVHRKLIERHRKYLIAVMVIYSNGYEIIRNHLGMILIKEGGSSS